MFSCSGFGSVIWTDPKKKQTQCQVVRYSKGQLYEERSWIRSSQWRCWRFGIEDYDWV